MRYYFSSSLLSSESLSLSSAASWEGVAFSSSAGAAFSSSSSAFLFLPFSIKIVSCDILYVCYVSFLMCKIHFGKRTNEWLTGETWYLFVCSEATRSVAARSPRLLPGWSQRRCPAEQREGTLKGQRSGGSREEGSVMMLKKRRVNSHYMTPVCETVPCWTTGWSLVLSSHPFPLVPPASHFPACHPPPPPLLQWTLLWRTQKTHN